MIDTPAPDNWGRGFQKHKTRSDRIWAMLMDFTDDIDWGDPEQDCVDWWNTRDK